MVCSCDPVACLLAITLNAVSIKQLLVYIFGQALVMVRTPWTYMHLGKDFSLLYSVRQGVCFEVEKSPVTIARN